MLQQLVRAVHETAAVRMLKAMGWREGQGAGERLPGSEKRRAREQHRVYGCYMPPEMKEVCDYFFFCQIPWQMRMILIM